MCVGGGGGGGGKYLITAPWKAELVTFEHGARTSSSHTRLVHKSPGAQMLLGSRILSAEDRALVVRPGIASAICLLMLTWELHKNVVVVVMGQELYPLGTKVLIVLCQSESVIRQSSRSDTRDIRRR